MFSLGRTWRPAGGELKCPTNLFVGIIDIYFFNAALSARIENCLRPAVVFCIHAIDSDDNERSVKNVKVGPFCGREWKLLQM